MLESILGALLELASAHRLGLRLASPSCTEQSARSSRIDRHVGRSRLSFMMGRSQRRQIRKSARDDHAAYVCRRGRATAQAITREQAWPGRSAPSDAGVARCASARCLWSANIAPRSPATAQLALYRPWGR